ncbi:MAG: hypothetical protein HQ580_10830 [Planctomycetes bacterium]|nr:hypothetical protein [Planctomycetota bacterium]
MNKSMLMMLLFILFSFAFFICLHSRSFSSSLRYTRIAEGNISSVIGAMWERGAAAYVNIVHGDAKQWGRIRPVHWLYNNIPFALIMLRNGDLFRIDPNVPVNDRINGDLQTYVLFLIITLAVATGGLAWLIWRVSSAWWAALLFLVYSASSLSVCENLLINYCDSQEIGQTLFLSLYLVGVCTAFAGHVPKRSHEILASIFLLFAYGMKETTVVALPIMIGVLGLRALPYFGGTRPFRRFCLRHIGLHVLLAVSLLTAVYLYKSGAYVTENYKINSDLYHNFLFSLNALSKGVPVLRLLLVGGVLAFFYVWRTSRPSPIGSYKNHGFKEQSAALWLTVVAVGFFAGFWYTNLPWRQTLPKYYLPAFFFAAWGGALLQGVAYQRLWKQGFHVAAIIWVVGSSFFMLEHMGNHRDAIVAFYRQNYEYRKTVPFISRDIVASVTVKHQPLEVQIIAGRIFQEGVLPFLRHVNLIYGINIWDNGHMVHNVKACERNYFHINPGRPSVHIILNESLPEKLEVDDVYVYDGTMLEREADRLVKMGYRLVGKWDIGDPATRLVKYTKSAHAAQ